MAIIKCPECGHQVSDKAEICPNCGVKIAEHVVTCPQCGEAYFNTQTECPNCHHITSNNLAKQATTEQKSPQQPINGNGHKKSNRLAIIILIIIVLIICILGLYLYNNSSNKSEQQAYDYAMTSTDSLILHNYLTNFKDAPQEHIDSIMQHLSLLRLGDIEWTNVVMSGSRAELESYLQNNPNTTHRYEIVHKMDSIDWSQASSANTLDAYNLYLNENPNGEHIDDANNAIKVLNTKIVLPEEKEAISSIFKQFFQSINSRDANEITANVGSILTSFLGKTDATKSDVITFMNKIYKDDITNMYWHINDDYKISKKDVGDNEYEYTVLFSVNQHIERTDATKEKEAVYQINSIINPDGKITAFNMTKIIN